MQTEGLSERARGPRRPGGAGDPASVALRRSATRQLRTSKHHSERAWESTSATQGNKQNLLRIPDKRKEDQLLPASSILQVDPAQHRGKVHPSVQSSPTSRGGSDQLSQPVMVLPKSPLGAHPTQRPTKLRHLERARDRPGAASQGRTCSVRTGGH